MAVFRKGPGLVWMTVLVCLVLFLSGSEAFGADDRLHMRGEGITIYYDAALEYEAGLLNRAYPGIREDIERMIGWKLRSKPTVYLVGDGEAFQKMGGSPLVAAFALFPKGHIVMNLSSFIQVLSLNQTFRHELCHLLLHDHIRWNKLPKWLDEGVCGWVSETVEEDISSKLEGFAMTYAISKRGFPLAEIARQFPRDGKGITLAYEQSQDFVEYIASRYGREGLVSVLSRLKKGDNVEKAFLEGLSKPLGTVESKWRTDAKDRVKWLLLAEKYAEETTEKALALWKVLRTHRQEAFASFLALLGFLVFTRAVQRKR